MKKTALKNTPPLEPVRFWEVVQCGIAAGQQVDPAVQNPAYDSKDGPWQKAAEAIAQLMHNDPAGYGPAMVRFQALMDLYVRDVLSDWMRPSGKVLADGQSSGEDIHPAVIDVAATARLSPNGRFARNRFLEAVERNAKENYHDFAPWPIAVDSDD